MTAPRRPAVCYSAARPETRRVPDGDGGAGGGAARHRAGNRLGRDHGAGRRESGAGKTTLARSILNLPPAPGRITSGEIWFDGRNLRALPERELHEMRGRRPLDDRAEPARRAQPASHRRRADRHAGAGAPEDRPQDGARPGAGHADLGAHPRPGAAHERLPARAVGRHGAARGHRHGLGLLAAVRDLGRRNQRPRRHRPGADPVLDEGAGARPAATRCCSSPATSASPRISATASP